MVVRLRLQRFGGKHKPFYRIVAADARFPRDGRHIEQLGTYNPIPMRDGVKEIFFNGERLRYWLSVGAQPSDRVAWIMAKCGIVPKPPERPSMKHIIPKSFLKK